MRVFGLDVTVHKGNTPVSESRGWWPLVREPYTGAWQRNDEWSVDTVLAYHAVYACITLIASDIGKLRPKLVEMDEDGIWSETTSAAFSPVLRKPNHFQNHIQFKEWWITSKLLRGNAYALKERDNRGVVIALYLLDPSRVKVLIAPDGAVYYELGEDQLAASKNVTVPASEIIHDRMNCLFHPLMGVSPIYACGSAANVGLNIQNSSSTFFGNGANPSGILTAPQTIPQATAERISNAWNNNFTGANAGKVAVMGDGLKFEPLRMTAVDAQLIQHLGWTAETVCSTFHIPAFKVGVGATPTYQNAALMNQQYYSDCLQSHIEQMEAALDEGLGVLEPKSGRMLGVELDLDGLLRMDAASQMSTLVAGVGGSVLSVNDARRKLDMKPVDGGDTIWMQQQNYSLEALAERDRNEPFAALPAPAPQLALPPGEPVADEDDADEVRSITGLLMKAYLDKVAA